MLLRVKVRLKLLKLSWRDQRLVRARIREADDDSRYAVRCAVNALLRESEDIGTALWEYLILLRRVNYLRSQPEEVGESLNYEIERILGQVVHAELSAVV